MARRDREIEVLLGRMTQLEGKASTDVQTLKEEVKQNDSEMQSVFRRWMDGCKITNVRVRCGSATFRGARTKRVRCGKILVSFELNLQMFVMC
jgi:predicted oxidoreductase